MWTVVLLASAIAPGLALAIYIYWKDKFEKEPRSLLIRGFLLGILSTLPALGLELYWDKAGYGLTADLRNTAFFAWVVVALSEEAAKFILLRFFLYKKKAFNEPYDGITYAVMVSMGFATLENIVYVWQGGMQVALLRALMSVPAHATFGVIMGYYVGLAKFRPGKGVGYLLMGLLGATFLHGLYDFSLMQSVYPDLKIIGAVLSLFIAVRLSLSAIRIHQNQSPFKDAENQI